MPRKLVFYLALVFVISFLADWGFQFGYWWWRVSNDPQAFDGVKTLWDYKSGFIGDMILLPVLNCLTFYVFFKLKVAIKKLPIFVIAIFSAMGVLAMHGLQGVLGLTNWSMRSPFAWNPVSVWHMFSAFFQLGAIFTFFYLIFRFRGEVVQDKRINGAAISGVALLLIFVGMFVSDYYGVFELKPDVISVLAKINNFIGFWLG
ncbi:MAG: hypothetical protein WD988_03755 [Candidatus Curtissbacteria bacterium]